MDKNINNEYFDLYLKICNSGSIEIQKIAEFLNKKFPHVFDKHRIYNDPFLDKFVFREKLVKIYAWAITDPKAIAEIVKTTKDIGIVEIGAGKGYWASLLANCGVNIVAYDIDNKNDANYYPVNSIGHYYPIDNPERKIISLHQEKALFLCWPPYDTPMAYNCVSEYNGNTLIYIGEDMGGCNADDSFF